MNAKNTKAEILTAYNQLRSQPTTWQNVATFVSAKAQTFCRELILFGQDCHKLGKFCRAQIDLIIDTYNRPILRG